MLIIHYSLRIMKPILLLFVCLAIGSCAEKPTETKPIVDDLPAGKRNFTWSADSIAEIGEISFQSLWGSSPNDIWGASFADNWRSCLWHYDGTAWRRAAANTPLAQANLTAYTVVGRVCGTAQNDVWAVGAREYHISGRDSLAPFTMHFNGTEWREVGGDATQMPIGARCVYTPRKGELYVGVFGALHRYKDGVWKKFPVVVGDIYHAVWRITSNEQGIYAIVLSGNPLSEFRFYRLHNEHLELLDSTPFTPERKQKFETSDIFLIKNRVITIGFGVAENHILSDGRIDTSAWKHTLRLPTQRAFWRGFMHNAKHIFAVGSQNLIYHYNGNDWVSLNNDKQPNPTSYSAVWADSGVVVVCDYDYGKIYRGK